jgi:hypothetical protein
LGNCSNQHPSTSKGEVFLLPTFQFAPYFIHIIII